MCICWFFFFKINFFEFFFRNTIWVSNRLYTDQAVMSCLICVQNVCKDYQQIMLEGKDLSNQLTLGMLDIFSCICQCSWLFFKINFLKKKSFRNTIRVSNGLDPDQVRHNVGRNLGPNCLQRLSTKDKSCRYKGQNFPACKELKIEFHFFMKYCFLLQHDWRSEECIITMHLMVL